jgi:hypothetical protein
VCGSSQNAVVFYPTNHDQSPLISFAHGFTAGGRATAADYVRLLSGVASWGYVIVALECEAHRGDCPRSTSTRPSHSHRWRKGLEGTAASMLLRRMTLDERNERAWPNASRMITSLSLSSIS